MRAKPPHRRVFMQQRRERAARYLNVVGTKPVTSVP